MKRLQFLQVILSSYYVIIKLKLEFLVNVLSTRLDETSQLTFTTIQCSFMLFQNNVYNPLCVIHAILSGMEYRTDSSKLSEIIYWLTTKQKSNYKYEWGFKGHEFSLNNTIVYPATNFVIKGTKFSTCRIVSQFLKENVKTCEKVCNNLHKIFLVYKRITSSLQLSKIQY